jgi:hypothetical protein
VDDERNDEESWKVDENPATKWRARLREYDSEAKAWRIFSGCLGRHTKNGSAAKPAVYFPSSNFTIQILVEKDVVIPEQRLIEITRLDRLIEDGTGIVSTPLACLHDAHALLGLLVVIST